MRKTICDGCGKDCMVDNGNEECASVSYNWGYNSKFDDLRGCFELCDDCFEKVVDSLGLGKKILKDYRGEEN